eukprot:CAMPEP_0119038326 /NCGR_PEP_ID=MMETSP1177-20130426/7170_1 /TAXON_ID=2985 /ORGANISM="Ochromonas sp, Strain CCMP1899" /LENGTH=1391 /DNA_ID=CAMNT_0007000755 /DNA_START=510 /DNA_END=4685 /DNA_ORIENTATION=-
MGTLVEKETFDDKFEHEKNEQYSPSIDCPNTENFNDKFEHEKSEQYSPSIDCPNTWRSAFIILSFIFATLLACMKFVNRISLSSIVQLKAGIRAEEVASNKKFVTLQRQTDVLLNEYFLDLEKEKAKISTLSGQLATRDDVILSNGRSLELLNQENESQLSQLFDDNAILNSRIVELEDLNRKGSDLIDLANENKLQLHELINDKTILSKHIVELEGLNQQKHAMHVMIENQMKEDKAKSIEITEDNLALNKCMTEMKGRIADMDMVRLHMAANEVEMMNQSDNDKNTIMMIRNQCTELQSIVDDSMINNKTSDDYREKLNCEIQEDKATMVELKVQSTELQRSIDEMIIEKKMSTEILADLDLRVLQLDSIVSSENDYKDKLDMSHTVIYELEKKVMEESVLSAGLDKQIKELSITLNDNLDKYLELDQNIHVECLNVAVLRGEKDIQVAINKTLDTLMGTIIVIRGEKCELTEKVELLHSELLTVRTQEGIAKTQFEVDLLTLQNDKIKNNEKDFVLSNVVRIERDQNMQGKAILESRIQELESDLKKQKIQYETQEELTAAKVFLDSRVAELEGELAAHRSESMTLEEQSICSQKILNKSIAEKILLDNKIVELLNEMQINTVSAQKLSEKYEISNNLVSQLECKMRANKSQLTESLGEYNHFVSKINTLEANETVLNNRINQYEKEKGVDREVDQDRDVEVLKSESREYNHLVTKINSLEANETVLSNRINQYEKEKEVDKEDQEREELMSRSAEEKAALLTLKVQEKHDEFLVAKEIADDRIAELDSQLIRNEKQLDDIAKESTFAKSECSKLQSSIDDMMGDKKMSDDYIVILESQIKEDYTKLSEISDLRRTLEADKKDKKVSDDRIVLLENWGKESERYTKKLLNQNALLETRMKSLHTRLRDLKAQRSVRADAFFLSESAIKESDLEIEAFQKGIEALTKKSPLNSPFKDELSPVKGSDGEDENCADDTEEVGMSFFASVAGDEDSYSDKSSDCEDPDRSSKMFRDIGTPEKNLNSHEKNLKSHESSVNSHEKSFEMFQDVNTPMKTPEASSDDSHKYLDYSLRERDADSPGSNVNLSNMSLGMFGDVDSIPSYEAISNIKFDFVKDRSSNNIQGVSNDDNDLTTESQRMIDLETVRNNDKEEGHVKPINESFSSKDESNSQSNSSFDIFKDVNSPICPYPAGATGPLTSGPQSISSHSINPNPRKNPSILVTIPSNNSTPIKKPFTPSPRKNNSTTSPKNSHLTPSLRRNLTINPKTPQCNVLVLTDHDTPESIDSKATVPLIDVPSVKKPSKSPHEKLSSGVQPLQLSNLTINPKTPESINSKATVPWNDTWDIHFKKPLRSPQKDISSGVQPHPLTPRKSQVLKDLSPADCNTRNNNKN